MFFRGRKLSVLLVFISQSCFKVPKAIRLNATQYFIIKIPNKRERHQIASNHLYHINFKDSMKLYEDYSFLVNGATLSSDNPLRFRKNVLQKLLLVRKLKQLITKLSKAKLNMI